MLTRVPPDAKQGKAAALNAAWHHLETLLSSGRWAGWPREQVVIAVIDADGRLDPHAPEYVAGHFADPRVGGLQVLVRIYNRQSPLTWCQDVEFSIYGFLFQAGRTSWGTAGMGGNGQFNRLAALDSIADAEAGGPWRNRLTEDQDLGLRLIEAGWRGVSEGRTSVNQQGLASLRRLLRQRTRWAQGNLQAMAHLGPAWRAELPWLVRVDLVAYLLQPVFQAVVGVAFLASILLAIFNVAGFWGDNGWAELLFFFLLGFGGVMLGCIARGARRGLGGIALGLLIVPVYAAYSWIVWPVLARATARQLTTPQRLGEDGARADPRRQIGGRTPVGQSCSNCAEKWRSVWRLPGDPQPAQVCGPRGDLGADLDHVVDVALRVGAAWDGEPHEIHRRGRLAPVRLPAEHDGADLAAADSAGDVERHRERLAGVLERRDVRQQRTRVDVDRVPAGRLQDREAGALQALRQVAVERIR